MIGELSFEWFKLSKRWMPRVVMVMLMGVIVLAFWGTSTRASNVGNLLLPRGWLTSLIFASFVAPFLWPVLGASWGGNEYGWGTIRMVLTRRPFRMQHVLGALAVLLFGLALALLVAAVASTVLAIIVAVATRQTAYTSSLLTGTFIATFCKAYLSAWVVASFYLLLPHAGLSRSGPFSLRRGRYRYWHWLDPGRVRARRHPGPARRVVANRGPTLPGQLYARPHHPRGLQWLGSRQPHGCRGPAGAWCQSVAGGHRHLQRHLHRYRACYGARPRCNGVGPALPQPWIYTLPTLCGVAETHPHSGVPSGPRSPAKQARGSGCRTTMPSTVHPP